MKKIIGLNSEPKQSLSFILENNNIVEIKLEYRENTKSWYYFIKKDGFEVNNRKLVISPNNLNSFKNIAGFGLAVMSNDKLEPYFIDDFETDRIELFILEESELNEIYSEYFINEV